MLSSSRRSFGARTTELRKSEQREGQWDTENDLEGGQGWVLSERLRSVRGGEPRMGWCEGFGTEAVSEMLDLPDCYTNNTCSPKKNQKL